MKIAQRLGLIGQLAAYCLTLGAPTALAGTVTVNVGVNVSESGQNDIDRMRGYCAGATSPSGVSFDANGAENPGDVNIGNVGPTTVNYLTRLGFNRLRGINKDNTDNGGSLDGNGNFKAGGELDSALGAARKHGYNPHIIVAQQVPKFLQDRYPNVNPWDWPENAEIWNTYRDYAYKFVRYVVSEYENSSLSSERGFSSTLFEVTNEIDVTRPDNNEVWTEQFPGDNGSEARYRHLRTVYEVWQAAVTRVANENKSRTVWVAGPGVGSAGIFSYPSVNWLNTFVNDVVNNKWRLNLYTFHTYGDQDAVGSAAPHPDFGYLRDNLQTIRDTLTSKGLASTQIGITEWGASALTGNPQLAKINYTHEGAAWTIAFVKDVAKNLNEAVYLQMRDNSESKNTGEQTEASFMHLRDAKEYPKPAYNACRMLGLLPGVRKQAIPPSAQPNLVAIASSNQNSAGVVVANYNYLFDFSNETFTDQSNPENVTIQFNSLPFSGRVIVQQYLIDANTSNLAKYLDANPPQTPDLNGTQLQKVSDTEVDIVNGSATLPQVTLGKAATSLWVIQSKNTVANGNYRITARHSLKSLDVENASQLDNAKVQQFGYGGGSNQQWGIASVSNGYYKITSKHTANTGSPKVLGVQSSNASCGTTVLQQTDSGSSNQRWQLVPMGGGFYKIAPQSAIDAGQNLVLDINGASGLNGTPAIMCGYGNMDNQMFRLDEP
jgi:xylan 1,4-beta-xylosidase